MKKYLIVICLAPRIYVLSGYGATCRPYGLAIYSRPPRLNSEGYGTAIRGGIHLNSHRDKNISERR
jgi:hypothetical protein